MTCGPDLGAVGPLYPTNGASWNDYVKDDGSTALTATDTACDAATDTACLHGGEHRALALTGTPSCTGITAADVLGAFDWVCDDSSGTATLLSTGLKADKGLSHLLEFALPWWAENHLIVHDGAAIHGISSTGDWWANPVEAANPLGTLGDAGKVYTLAADSLNNYTLAANKVALAAAAGVVVDGLNYGYGIAAANRDFIWVDGVTVDATSNDRGVSWLNVRFSVLRGVNALNAGTGERNGIALYGSTHNTLHGMQAGANGANGIYLDGSTGNALRLVTVSGNTGSGIRLNDASSNNTLSTVTATGNGATGVHLFNGSNGNALSTVVASGNADGIVLSTVTGNTLSDISATGNTDDGILVFNGADNNTLTDIAADDNGANGIHISTSDGTDLTTAVASDNGGNGVYVYGPATGNAVSVLIAERNGYAGIYTTGATGNAFAGIAAADNPQAGLYLNNASDDNTAADLTLRGNGAGIKVASSAGNRFDSVAAMTNSTGVLIASSTGHTLTGVVAANNWANGVALNGGADHLLAGVTASHNGTHGLSISGSDHLVTGATTNNNGLAGIALGGTSNVLTNGTTTNNAYNGLEIGGSTHTVTNVAASNNGSAGIGAFSATSVTVANATSADNAGFGVRLWSSSYNTFTGALQIGGNGGTCDVSGGTDAGLVHSTCANNGSSDATLTTGVSTGNSYVGKVATDDAVNTDDTAGAATITDLRLAFDWSGFANSARGWGADGGAFPASTNRGRLGCSDTTYTNQTDCEANLATWNGAARIWDWSLTTTDSVLREALTLATTGDETLTHTWSDATTTTALRNAVELLEDAQGDDDTLCETGEDCLYTPNMGAYQGHGSLVSAGSIGTGGSIENVTLYKQGTNGR